MYLEDYRPGVVFALGQVSITEQEILDFGRSYDPQPFHTDLAAAADGPFGGVIASGWQTCGLTMRALVAEYFSPLSSLGSPGIDEIRWPAPVRPGDVLSVEVEVLDNRRSASRPDRGIVRSAITSVNQQGAVVLTMNAINLVRARP